MTSTAEEIFCYNKGCGIKFKPLNAKEDDCCYHPGSPVFHDAYKGWSCCSQKTTDFTTFLNMKGCFKGKHNPVKPPEPEKRTPDFSTVDEVITVRPPVERSPERPDFDTEMFNLKVIVSQSLKTALENSVKTNCKEIKESEGSTIQLGESCKNNSCKESYVGEESNLEMCLHHPGTPIFHEGLKYWTCCNRKTTDFEIFLNQKGCTTGSHIWIKKFVKEATCRYDWHQTATHVCIAIYAKLTRSELSYVKASPIRLQCNIIFGKDNKFDLDHELGGIIDTDQSNVTFAASKIEISMKKSESKHWTYLFLASRKGSEESEVSSTRDDTQSPNLDVDAIDLNDI